jgi:Cft2 family RNA processing exonuclease
MRFTNLTRQTEIGANSYYLQLDGKKVVLDAGLHPKNEGEEALPLYRLLPAGAVDSILITHAHQDHIGSLPVLMRHQPQARVFMTHPTAKITDAMLHNSVNVMSRLRDELGIRSYPLFSHRETDNAAQLWQSVGLGQYWTLAGERVPKIDEDDPTFEMYDAGHILGSAGIYLRGEGKKIFYTGDVNFLGQTVMKPAEFPKEPLDVLIIETTRGDRELDPHFSRANEEERFIDAIEAAFLSGGSVLVPVFALGKTQEILTILHLAKLKGRLAKVPIYIGGLSTKITIIHDQLASLSKRQYQGLQILDSIAPYVLSSRELATTQINRNRIYSLSSGMMTEKTLSNRLASRFLGDPKQSIFFVGYADPNSPGGRLKAAKKGDLLQLDEDSPSQRLDCAVQEFDFSAHAPRELLLDYIRKVTPRVVVLVHGDLSAITWFQRKISEEMPKTRIVIPEPGREYEF